MKKSLRLSLSFVAVFAFGYVVGHMSDMSAQAQGEKAAYLIAAPSKNLKPDPEKQKAYSAKAGPLAKAAGLELLARGESGRTVQVLEGKWPYEGAVAVEKFRSMKALTDFWNSKDYQEAKKLRQEANFIIAVEAVQ
jgi:uncharacterized protein (DUF1330 family)